MLVRTIGTVLRALETCRPSDNRDNSVDLRITYVAASPIPGHVPTLDKFKDTCMGTQDSDDEHLAS